jgi:hypothetical protein
MYYSGHVPHGSQVERFEEKYSTEYTSTKWRPRPCGWEIWFLTLRKEKTMASMTEYYSRMKGGIASIDPQDATQLGEDWLITCAAGMGTGLISGAIGGLDKKIAGITVPIDGLMSLGIGGLGLVMKGDSGKILKLASIALGGSAAVRTWEKFFKGAFHVKGEFEDLGGGYSGLEGGGMSGRWHGLPGYQQRYVGPGVGFGVGEQDRLVEASRYL